MASDLVILERQLEPLKPRLSEALGAIMPVARLIRTVVISCERLPKLLECDRQSLFNSAMSAACLGLEVDGVTGQGFLIPFKGKAQLVIGYKGYNTMGARSGITITGGVVREGDEFAHQEGTGGFIRHIRALGKGRDRRIIAAWAWAQALDRPGVPSILDVDELLAVKAKSPGGSRSDSPWNDPSIGFPAMCEKTAKRRLARSLPLTVMHLAARMEEAVDEQGKNAWIDARRGVVVDGEILPPMRHDTRTPDVMELIGPSPSGFPSRGGEGHGEGGHPHAAPADASPSPPESSESDSCDSEAVAAHDLALADAAKIGTEALAKAWGSLPPPIQHLLTAA
jgi:recombination protein RecT